MNKRIDIEKISPKAYDAIYGLENYLQDSSLTKISLELIRIRASQINGCAFCINMHTSDALKLGETPQRIFLLSVWRETSLFSKEEQIILAMTEEITLINKNGLSDETYMLAKDIFNENEIAEIMMAIITINAWNRIGISTKMTV
ncbi:carboxymuconolactone decarboxylase family protein [Chishuiella sp.]|uniref:carboxymuconolactone decarboxylase family protein n=1 Tax=Chishuiella sp. TaxID=1969467 RepID=UPI0028AD43DE|nr:carboxymuconolactone decarboxylase family protein [Chishuiella sp.]